VRDTGVGEVVDDEPCEESSQCETHGVGEVVNDEPHKSRATRTRGVGEVVNDEPREEPRHPDMRCRQSRSVTVVRWVVVAHDRMIGHTTRARATD
jgi:hypothetical protein